jgi:phosphogluconate dehydratase
VDLSTREPARRPVPPLGTGRELFALMRNFADDAERGASAMLAQMDAEI